MRVKPCFAKCPGNERLWGSASGRLAYETRLHTCVEYTDELRLPGLVPVFRVSSVYPRVGESITKEERT
jgi:hypothetical protein